jgi:hypothetical protein
VCRRRSREREEPIAKGEEHRDTKTDRKEQGRQIDPGEESIQASNDKYQTTWAVLWISKAPPKVFLALSY